MFASRFWNSAYLLLVLAALFWSGNFIAGRAIGDSVPPVALAFWRWVFSSLILLAFARRHLQSDWPTIRRQLPILIALAALGITGFNTLIYIGLRSTTAVNALLMQSAIPMATLIFSFFLLGERSRFRQIAGVLVSLTGIATIATQGSPQDVLHLSLNPGDGAIIAAVAVWGLYTTLLSKRPSIHPLSFLASTFVLGVIMLTPIYIWEYMSGARIQLEPRAMLFMGYIIIFPSVIAYFFYNRGVELVGGGKASLFIHLMPVFGTLLAVLFLGESVRPFHLGGITLIGTGLWLAARATPKAVTLIRS